MKPRRYSGPLSIFGPFLRVLGPFWDIWAWIWSVLVLFWGFWSYFDRFQGFCAWIWPVFLVHFRGLWAWVWAISRIRAWIWPISRVLGLFWPICGGFWTSIWAISRVLDLNLSHFEGFRPGFGPFPGLWAIYDVHFNTRLHGIMHMSVSFGISHFSLKHLLILGKASNLGWNSLSLQCKDRGGRGSEHLVL